MRIVYSYSSQPREIKKDEEVMNESGDFET